METKTLLTGLLDPAYFNDLPFAADLRGSLAINLEAADWRIRNTDKIKGMVWHQALGDSSVEAVAKYHTGPKSHLKQKRIATGKTERGVRSIAYTLAIRKNGQIVLCNDLEKKPWSQGYRDRPGDENAEFLSVMFEGKFNAPGVKGGEPTLYQMKAGLILFEVCKKLWGWDDKDLFGHFDFGKSACPGNTLQSIIEAVGHASR